MTAKPPLRHAALALFLSVVVPHSARAAERREKIAVMKVDAPALNKDEASSLRDRLEVGVTRAVGTRLQVITRDSAAASVGGGDKLLTCMEGASCDAEIGGALGVDYFVSASVRQTALGLELGVTLLRIGRDVSLLRKDVRAFRSMGELLGGTSSHAEAVTRVALGGLLGSPAAQASSGAFGETGKDLVLDGAVEVVVAFESTPSGAVVLVDGAVVCKETPCRKRIAVGDHEASFQRDRYVAALERFTAAKGATVKATLAPRFGWVTVETEPVGVGIAIDGTDAGRSPIASHEVDEGTVEVAVSDPCYLRNGERIAVRASERKAIKLKAQPRIAGLRVNAEDEKGNAVDGDVRVDGNVAGAAGEVLKVPVCSKKVTVALGKATFEAALKLEEGKVAVVNARPGERAAAGGFTGKWKGAVHERGIAYTAMLNVTGLKEGKTCSKVEYPELRCGGELICLSVSEEALTLRENILVNRAGCVDGGKIVLRFRHKDRRSLEFAYFYPNGNPGPTAVLQKVSQ